MATEPTGRGPTLVVVALIFATLAVSSLFTPDYIIPSPRQMLGALVELLTLQSGDLVIIPIEERHEVTREVGFVRLRQRSQVEGVDACARNVVAVR